MATSRFERLERERALEAERAERAGRRSRIEDRFGGGPGGETGEGPARSGAAGARFEERPPGDEPLRVLDTDQGQAFVRCARCRSDHYATAERCGNCEADLTTPDQRAFNRALFEKLEAERAEQAAAAEALRERRADAEREQAEAMRRRQTLEAELERRRELGLPLDDEDDVSDPLRAGARGLGGFLGRTLVRLVPNPSVRVAVLVGSGLAVVALLFTFPRLIFGGLWILLILGGLAGRRRRGPRWRF